MQMRYKMLLVVFISIVLNGCGGNASKDKMSNNEQAQLFMQMGARYLKLGMLKIAKEKLEEGEALDANNADIHNLLGVLYERLKKVDEAGQQYQLANQLGIENAGIKNNYGRFLCEKGDYQAGKELLLAALALPLNRRKWFAYTNLAKCELSQGHQKVAERYFRMALRMNKTYSPALAEMQKISYQLEKYMSARAFLERYLAVAKHSAQTLWYGIQTERVLGNRALEEQYREYMFRLFPLSEEMSLLNNEK